MPRSKSYSNYSHENLTELGLNTEERSLNLQQVIKEEPSDMLKQLLAFNLSAPLLTEKAKSELLIAPILNDLRFRYAEHFTFYSGYQCNVDKSLGLQGFCDYIITEAPRKPYIQKPIFAIVEAKNEFIEGSTPQCIAEMYASYIFNQKDSVKGSKVIYGAVTNAYEWLLFV
jgi:hypothetical protein